MASDYLIELKALLKGYFHEDCEPDAVEPNEVISNYLARKRDLNFLNLIVDQIAYYLNGVNDDSVIGSDFFS